MKRLMTAVLIALSLLGTGSAAPTSAPDPATATDEAVEGFNGLVWGTKRTDVPGLVYAETDPNNREVKGYRKPGDTLSFGQVPLKGIVYFFWNEKLSRVRLEFKGSDTLRDMLRTCVEKYGQFSRVSLVFENYYWSKEKAILFLTYNKDAGTGTLMISSKAPASFFAPEPPAQ